MMKIKYIGLGLVLALNFTSVAADPPANASSVQAHLEFEGYDISMNSSRMKATHSTELNFFIKKYRGGMLVTSFFGGNDYSKSNRNGFLKAINQLNAKAAAGRYYIDSDGDLAIEAFYPGTYDKKSFANFLETFELERTHLTEMGDEITNYLD
ncbi:hypothetical protein GTH32_01000 [Alteromonas sp. 345S023]|uniref:YbjN domain-containing protein n=1 Tax=Alteromonas profundi TaxID=2696062 RepID=A0A7X5RJL6_9ALTE|nr:hypothetical protein [Alteromonas profundi]NDV89774.1 hypothetical protein [Alteromonas profundi]